MTVQSVLGRIGKLPVRNAEALRGLRRELSAELRAEDRKKILELACGLTEHGSSARLLAYELVKYHGATCERMTAAEVRRLGRGIADWGAVDTFACYIAGPAWRAGRLSNEVIQKWARSHYRWWKRAALVSTVPLNVRAQGGAGDAARTLAVCEALVDDRDDMVVKAMSWALRALAVRDEDAVRKFIVRFEARLAPRVKREVGNKLRTGLKNPTQPRSRGRSLSAARGNC